MINSRNLSAKAEQAHLVYGGLSVSRHLGCGISEVRVDYYEFVHLMCVGHQRLDQRTCEATLRRAEIGLLDPLFASGEVGRAATTIPGRRASA